MIDSGIAHHFPALLVIIPLLASAFCVLVKKGSTAWLISAIAVTISFALASIVLFSTSDGNIFSYHMGGWEPPYGIEYKTDILNSFIIFLVAAMGAIMFPYAKKSVEQEIDTKKQPLFYSVYLLCFAGLLGILSTNDIFNIYVFLEISSLAMYSLIAMGKDRRALTSAYEYLILGTIGATFILIGIGLLYITTGTLNITDIATRINDVEDTRPIEAAFAFLTLGLMLKIAMFPLHIWLTNSYAYSPSFISAFLASTATKVSVYVLIRVLYTIFGYEYCFETMPLGGLIIALGIAGIFIGSITAIYQFNIKRMLAFSSVAQLGYIALGIGIANETGLTASLVHLFNHALAKGCLFLAVGAVMYRINRVRIIEFHGLAKKMPWTCAAFVVGGLSLIGVPFTTGFISKWYFIKALIEEGHFILIAALLISSLLAVIYIWKVVEAAYFKPLNARNKHATEVPLSMLIPMWSLVIANIYFGINTELTLGIAEKASAYLLKGAF